MIGMDVLPQMIRSAILSTKIDMPNSVSVSLFIVAPFESGKTRLTLQNIGKDSLILTDITGIGLLEALQQNNKATTVVINDLTVATAHRENVNKLTIAIINGLAEEGVYTIAVPKLAHLNLRGRNVNVIACCVPGMEMDKRSWWYRSGFLSRVLMVRFHHSVNLQLAIHKAIQNGEVTLNETKILNVPEHNVKVSMEAKEAGELAVLAKMISNEHGEMGYRKHKQIRSLAAGHALLRSWKKAQVLREDVEFIEQCLPFLVKGKEI